MQIIKITKIAILFFLLQSCYTKPDNELILGKWELQMFDRERVLPGSERWPKAQIHFLKSEVRIAGKLYEYSIENDTIYVSLDDVTFEPTLVVEKLTQDSLFLLDLPFRHHNICTRIK